MNNRFDELTKSLAESVTRRAALKRFGVGLAGMALACFGLTNKAEAGRKCLSNEDCNSGVCCNGVCCTNKQICCMGGWCSSLAGCYF